MAPTHAPVLRRAVALALTLAAGTAASADYTWGNPNVAQGLLNLLPLGSETAAAVQNGAWSDPATWGGATPAPGDDVLVPAGITVLYDVFDNNDGAGANQTRVRYLRVDGELRWATDRDTALYVDTLFSAPGGRVIIGDASDPIPAGVRAEIVITADAPMDLARDPGQVGRGFIPHGTTRVFGADTTDSAALASDVSTGATSLTLRAAPVGWNVGDTLVLAGTYFDENGSNDDNSRFHDEVLTITGITKNVVSFTANATGAGLRFDHARPDGAHFNPDDLTIYVANLTRNVVFRSELDPMSPQASAPPIAFPGGSETPVDPANFQRGHFMAMHSPDLIVRNASFLDFGRSFKDKLVDEPVENLDGSPGAGANQRGRYAFHLHRNLPRQDQPVPLDTATPAQVTGCVVWGSPGWGFVHHDSYAVFEDNVAYDIVGSAFVQEAGNEIGLWRNNLSIKTTGDANPEMTVEPFGEGAGRVARFDFGFNGEGYWIQGASQVVFENNSAVSAAGGGAQIFSQVDGLNDQRDMFDVPMEHLRPEIQYIVTRADGQIDVSHAPMQTFRGFEVSNSDFGLITWGHMRNQSEWIGFTCPCDSIAHRERSRIEDFAFWNIYGQGVHMQYTSQLDLVDGIVASSDLATPADDKPNVDLGINGEGRGFGVGMNGPTKRLLLDNVAIEGWRYGLRTPLEGQINELDLGIGTGSEGAIGLPARASRFVNLRMANNDHHLYRRQNGFSNPQPFPNWLQIEGGDFAPDVPNAPPVAGFDVIPAARNVVRLSAASSFDSDTPAGAANQFNVVAVGDPNSIVAYAWDLDGDGVSDRFGEEIVVALPSASLTPITLTVWDHQGATDSVTLDVAPSAADPVELLVDGGFNAPSFEGGIYALSSSEASTGWFEARAAIDAGGARLTGQYRFSSIAQAVYNERVSRGNHTLSFDLASSEGDDAPNGAEINRVTARVFGVRGEFGSSHSDASPIPYSAVPVEIELLYEETFTGDIPMQRYERAVDLGADGYDYLYVGFEGEGVTNTLPDDFALIDNVSLLGAPACIGDLDTDGVVGPSDLAMLIGTWSGKGPADLTGDGVIDVVDLAILINVWGACPN